MTLFWRSLLQGGNVYVFFINARVFIDLGSNESDEKGRKKTICILFYLCDTLYIQIQFRVAWICHP